MRGWPSIALRTGEGKWKFVFEDESYGQQITEFMQKKRPEVL